MTSVALPQQAAQPARVYLHPGQLFASAEPAAVTTILGSCVAVCLWDRSAGIGGLNHFLLPRWPGSGPRGPRFAAAAMEELLARMRALGSRTASMQAKVFGGACLTPNVPGREAPLGEQNVACAMDVLHEHGIPVSAASTGGTRGRKLVFHTADGTAWVKEL